MKADIAVEEAFVQALSELVQEHRGRIGENEARMLADLVRRHRVGLIKQRAILGALGLDV